MDKKGQVPLWDLILFIIGIGLVASLAFGVRSQINSIEHRVESVQDELSGNQLLLSYLKDTVEYGDVLGVYTLPISNSPYDALIGEASHADMISLTAHTLERDARRQFVLEEARLWFLAEVGFSRQFQLVLGYADNTTISTQTPRWGSRIGNYQVIIPDLEGENITVTLRLEE